ncbi:MAG: carboxypeptidase regulatory-like domain-containing protein [Pseudomonadota bacterium]|nr:carboxypeptidase regulatory-like domain-containing protein [Pseudomonadota bacterium]
MFERNTVQIILLALLALFASVPAFAQSTSASLAGRIIDAQGAPVASATVDILHQPSGSKQALVTDDDGRFSTRGLRVGGPYTVTASKDGLDTSRDDVFLLLAETASVTLTLASDAAELEAIEVVASSALSAFTPDNMGASTNITVEQIEELPSIGRSIGDYVRFDPRIVQTDKGRGELSAAGQNSRYNNIRVDGVPTNDQFGLNASGLPALNQPISIDWIQEFNVGISNFDVTQTDFVGANINAVTKSGGNEFSGGVYAVYRNNDMVGDEPADFTAFDDEYTVGAYVGGPIIKDTLFFFLGYEEFQRSSPAPDVGVVGSGASTIVQGLTQADLDRIATIAQTQYGLNLGGTSLPAGLDNTDEKLIAKIDWNINDAHRMTFRYNKTEGVDQVLSNLGRTAYSFSSNWFQSNISFENYALLLYSNWSDSFSTEANISYSSYDSAPTFDIRAPQVRVGVNNDATGVFFGTERSRQSNLLGVDTLTGYFAGDWFLGDHVVRMGFDYEANDVYNLFLQDTFGNYNFSSIDNFAAGTWRTFAFQTLRPGVTSAAAEFEFANLGLFVQDTWTYSPNLNFQYGFRVDRNILDESPPFNAAALTTFGFDNTLTTDGQTSVQPRLGFNYTFDTERATQLRGGVGLFQGSSPGVWLSNSFSNPGVLTQGVSLQNGSGFNPNPDTQAPPLGTPPAALVNFLAPDFQQPTVWKINLAFEHELPWMGLVAGAEWLRNVTEQGVAFEHLNLGAARGILPDGRYFYWTTVAPTGFTATGNASTNSNRHNRNRSFTDVVLLKNTNKGMSDNLTLSLDKPFEDNWSARVAYTYGKSTEVSPGTSSVALSNWNNRAIFNPNEEANSSANYEIRDRYTGLFTYRLAFAEDFPTTFGLFYEGRTGRTHSYGFTGDANGDGIQGNDLFYVPLDGEVTFTATSSAADIAAFQAYIDSQDSLSASRGSVAHRNGSRSPYINQFDLRISQAIPAGFGNRAEIFLDIQNIGNLVNKDWGHIDEVGFPYNLGVARFAGVSGGRYVYDVSTYVNETTGALTLPSTGRADGIGQSRWSAQVGVRYEF